MGIYGTLVDMSVDHGGTQTDMDDFAVGLGWRSKLRQLLQKFFARQA
jgi:hypothetical protein